MKRHFHQPASMRVACPAFCAGIDIAHPDFQEQLEREADELNYL
jgi:hypothetical protein